MRVVHWFSIVVILWSRVPSLAQSSGQGPWTRVAPMPLARQEVSSAALDGKVYVIAGLNPGGGPTSDVQVYDPKTNSWRPAKSLPIANDHNGAAVAGGR